MVTERPAERSWPWWAVAGLLLAAFVVLACLPRLVPALSAWDRHVTESFIRWRSPGRNRAFWAFTLIGDDPVMGALSAALVVPLALWGKRAWALCGATALLAAWGLMNLTKALVGRERPPQLDALIHRPVSHSMPSGHALVSMVFVGLLAYLAVGWIGRRLPGTRAGAAILQGAVVLAAAAVTGMIGVSRVYLGVHWLSDVIAGWCLGGVILAAALWFTLRWKKSGGPRYIFRDAKPWGDTGRRCAVVAVLAMLVVALVVVTALVDPLK